MDISQPNSYPFSACSQRSLPHAAATLGYKRVLGDSIEVQMAPVPFDLTAYQRASWMDQESHNYVLEGSEKFVYYIARYQISRGKIQEWLATLDRE